MQRVRQLVLASGAVTLPVRASTPDDDAAGAAAADPGLMIPFRLRIDRPSFLVVQPPENRVQFAETPLGQLAVYEVVLRWLGPRDQVRFDHCYVTHPAFRLMDPPSVLTHVVQDHVVLKLAYSPQTIESARGELELLAGSTQMTIALAGESYVPSIAIKPPPFSVTEMPAVPIGASHEASIRLTNQSKYPLAVKYELRSPEGVETSAVHAWTLRDTAATVPPGEQAAVRLMFAPTVESVTEMPRRAQTYAVNVLISVPGHPTFPVCVVCQTGLGGALISGGDRVYDLAQQNHFAFSPLGPPTMAQVYDAYLRKQEAAALAATMAAFSGAMDSLAAPGEGGHAANAASSSDGSVRRGSRSRRNTITKKTAGPMPVVSPVTVLGTAAPSGAPAAPVAPVAPAAPAATGAPAPTPIVVTVPTTAPTTAAKTVPAAAVPTVVVSAPPATILDKPIHSASPTTTEGSSHGTQTRKPRRSVGANATLAADPDVSPRMTHSEPLLAETAALTLSLTPENTAPTHNAPDASDAAHADAVAAAAVERPATPPPPPSPPMAPELTAEEMDAI
ncbi:hypothetical protein CAUPRSCDRAFT_12178, partial [Caulochytrium protostelioides]